MSEPAHRRLLRACLPVALLWLTGVFATASALAVPARPALWHATSAQGEVYLFGSMHFGRPEMYPLPETVETAFRTADSLTVEVDVGAVRPEDLMRLMARQGMYLDGSTLDAHVSEATMASLAAAAARYGLPMEVLRLQKPWLVALTLAGVVINQSGFSETQGVDRYFLERARHTKPIHELETFEGQLSLMAGLTAQDQEWMLADMLANLAETPTYFNLIYEAWSSGDDAAMDDMLNDSLRSGAAQRRLFDRFMTERNQAMANRIEGLIQRGGTSFIVVGAGHLVGDASIVELLRRRGYRVERR